MLTMEENVGRGDISGKKKRLSRFLCIAGQLSDEMNETIPLSS